MQCREPLGCRNTQGGDARHLKLTHLDPLRAESVDRACQFVDDHYGRLDGVIVLPATENESHGHTLSAATDDDVRAFVEQEVVAPVAFASALARNLSRWRSLRQAPAITFVTNPDDGHANLLNEVRRAAVEELIRVWRAATIPNISKSDGCPGAGPARDIVHVQHSPPARPARAPVSGVARAETRARQSNMDGLPLSCPHGVA